MNTQFASEVAFAFKPGVRVRLRSGGPRMTVRAIDENYVYCNWFDMKAEVRVASFPAETLDVDDNEVEA